jgi:hypothetical protein
MFADKDLALRGGSPQREAGHPASRVVAPNAGSVVFLLTDSLILPLFSLALIVHDSSYG